MPIELIKISFFTPVSAIALTKTTPSEQTINFYLRLGCKVSQGPDPDLFELEPEDIHLEAEV